MWDYKYRLTAVSHFSAVMWDLGTASRCVVFTLLTVNELTQVIDWGGPPAVAILVSRSFLRGFSPSLQQCSESGIAPSSDTSMELIFHCMKLFKKKKKNMSWGLQNVYQVLNSCCIETESLFHQAFLNSLIIYINNSLLMKN